MGSNALAMMSPATGARPCESQATGKDCTLSPWKDLAMKAADRRFFAGLLQVGPESREKSEPSRWVGEGMETWASAVQ